MLGYDFSSFHPRYRTLPYATPDGTALARLPHQGTRRRRHQ